VKGNEEIPADMIILDSEKESIYVDTFQIDKSLIFQQKTLVKSFISTEFSVNN